MLLALLVYDGSIFYSRWASERDAERTRARQEAEEARKSVEFLGGNELHIINFYAYPAAIRLGGHASVCYGVVGAKRVRLEPPVENVWPAVTRCFPVSPRKDTEYKLIAEDDAGHSVSQSVVLRVVR